MFEAIQRRRKNGWRTIWFDFFTVANENTPLFYGHD